MAGAGIAAKELGTMIRVDGAKQVTHNRHPLDQYTGDRAPGDTRGQGLSEFGETWYVVAPLRPPQGDELDVTRPPINRQRGRQVGACRKAEE